MSADAILKALSVAGIPATGLNIKDEADRATWVIDGKLTDEQRSAAADIIDGVLNPRQAEVNPETKTDEALAEPLLKAHLLVLAGVVAALKKTDPDQELTALTKSMRDALLAQKW